MNEESHLAALITLMFLIWIKVREENSIHFFNMWLCLSARRKWKLFARLFDWNQSGYVYLLRHVQIINSRRKSIIEQRQLASMMQWYYLNYHYLGRSFVSRVTILKFYMVIRRNKIFLEFQYCATFTGRKFPNTIFYIHSDIENVFDRSYLHASLNQGNKCLQYFQIINSPLILNRIRRGSLWFPIVTILNVSTTLTTRIFLQAFF